MHVMVSVEYNCSSVQSSVPSPRGGQTEDRQAHYFFDVFTGRRALTMQQVQSFLQGISPYNGETVIHNSMLTSSEDIWKRALLNVQHSQQASEQLALHFMIAVLRMPFTDSRKVLVMSKSSIARVSNLLGLSFNQDFEEALNNLLVEGSEAHSSRLEKIKGLVSLQQRRRPVADPSYLF